MELIFFLWLNIINELLLYISSYNGLLKFIYQNFLYSILEYFSIIVCICLALIYRGWIFINIFYFYSIDPATMIIWVINLIIIYNVIYTLYNCIINNELTNDFSTIILINMTEYLILLYFMVNSNNYIKWLCMINVLPFSFGLIIILIMTQTILNY